MFEPAVRLLLGLGVLKWGDLWPARLERGKQRCLTGAGRRCRVNPGEAEVGSSLLSSSGAI